MDNESITDIAWPVNIESMSLTKQPTLLTDKVKDENRRYRRCWGITCYPCSWLCIALLLVLALTLLAIIAGFLTLFLAKNKGINNMVFGIDTNLTTNTTFTTMSTIITTTTTTTTTSIASTTTTEISCGVSCLNQSWNTYSRPLAFWPFDGSYTDISNGYNGIPSTDPPLFVAGYLGQALLFDASKQQTMYTSFIPLNNVSFTIEAWIKPTGYPNSRDHSIIGLCPVKITDQCLHINIRSKKLYFGFYRDDIQGQTEILIDQWIHAAFSFDLSTNLQIIYLNGFEEARNTASYPLKVSYGNFTVGINEGVNFGSSYFQGYVDQLMINRRLRSSCEILEIATLAGRFTFNTPSPYADSGPNGVATAYLDTSIITGHANQAISFSGSSMSYFQASGFTSMGISNKPFSLALWIQPQLLSGTLVHLSTTSSGTGSQCFPLLGFDSNGAIVAQVLTGNNTVVTATGPILPISSSWISIVQTWSSTNGLKLYVNNTLVSSVIASTFLGSETAPNYLTLGNSLNGRSSRCSNGLVSAPGPFTGAIDDWRIFSRELTIDDVCTLHFAS